MLRPFYNLATFRRFSSSLMKRKSSDIASGPNKTAKMAATINLSPKEHQLKSFLLEVASLSDSKQAKEGKLGGPLVLRWAGGWVRDKLLGLESHDIDTAINAMTGASFVTLLCEASNIPEVRERHNIGPDDIGNLHRVLPNPEKSKHLETACIPLFGLDLDFVNLRKETYAIDSRNPQVEFGTAEEDALRRDATVNALFYNLHTGEVEDFTKGLPDLDAKIIRTPMEPLQTFTDDPLRVLRLVRFASRLQFTIDPVTREVMANPRVLDSLKLKISRERVGIEMEKMLKGKYPLQSLHLIDEIGLYHAIFTDPNRQDMPKPDLSNWAIAYECLHYLMNSRTQGSLHDILVDSTDEERYLSWALAAVTPWEQLPDDTPKKAGKSPLPLATQASREGIRANNKLSDVITAAHRNRPSILELKDLVCRQDAESAGRDRLGMAIRAWDSRGGHWKLQVLFTILVDVMDQAAGGAVTQDDRDKILAGWKRFMEYLKALDLMDAPSVKRIIDGRQLAQALGVKPGKWMTAALDVVMAWQLRNPNDTEPAGAIEEVAKRKEELGIR